MKSLRCLFGFHKWNKIELHGSYVKIVSNIFDLIDILECCDVCGKKRIIRSKRPVEIIGYKVPSYND